MSKLSDKVLEFLNETYGYRGYHIKKEYFVVYEKQKLFFDFYLPELLIAVEAQGAQHDKYVEHFHVDRSGFLAHKKRDKLKKAWAIENSIVLIEVRPKDLPLSEETFFSLATIGNDYD